MYCFNEVFEDDTSNVKKIPKSRYKEYGKIPIIDQGKNFIAGYTDEDNEKKIRTERIIFGDHTKVIKYVDFESYIGADGVKVLKLKRDNISYKYMYYYLKNIYIPNTGYNRHYKWLKETKFKIPTEIEQNKIVRNLDEVQKIIDIRKKQIEELDELIKAQFVEMFEDKNFIQKSLNEICIIKGEYGSGASAGEYIEGQPRYVRITDIREDGKLNTQSLASPKNEKNIDKYILKYGDLLFARTGATVGKTYKYNESDGDCIFAGYCIRFRLNLEICNPDYIFIYTKTDDYKKWVENKQRVVAQPNINSKEYGNDLKIPVPPIELQNQFADIVRQIDKQKFEIQKSLEKIEKLQDSLMNKYFG